MHTSTSRTLWIAALLYLAMVAISPISAEEAPAWVDELFQLEQGIWNAWKKQDMAHLKASIADDYLEVTYPAMERRTKTKVLENGFDIVKITDFKLTEPLVKPLGDNARLISYRVVYSGEFSGKKFTTELMATSIWKKGEKWQNTFYQETPVRESDK